MAEASFSSVSPGRARDHVVTDERVRFAALPLHRRQKARIGVRLRAEHGEPDLFHLKEAENFRKSAEMIDVRMGGNECQSGHVQPLEIAHEFIVRRKGAVARVDHERVPVRKFRNGAVALPDGQKMQTHLPLLPGRKRSRGQQGAEGNEIKEQGHGCRRKRNARRTQNAHDGGVRSVGAAHLPAFFLRAAAIAASISGRCSFASR